MALPLIPAVISGGAALAGSAINALSGASANKKNLEFQERMYERQKNDNLSFWNLQNDYNNPQQQMKRLQEAGLNPNLVYGSGGQTGGTASPISAPDRGSYNHAPQSLDIGGAASTAFSTYFDTQIKQAQLDNLKAQNTDIVNSALLKSAQTMSTIATGGNTEFKTQFLKDTAHITRAFMSEQANKMHYDQYQSQSAAGIADEKNALTLDALKQNISNMKDTGKSIQIRNALMEIEKELRANGLSPNDPVYMRLINRILNTKVYLFQFF